MRKMSELGLTGWDPDRVTAWVTEVPFAEIPEMIDWLGADPGKGGADDPKSCYAVAVVRGLLYHKSDGWTEAQIHAHAEKWADVLTPDHT